MDIALPGDSLVPGHLLRVLAMLTRLLKKNIGCALLNSYLEAVATGTSNSIPRCRIQGGTSELFKKFRTVVKLRKISVFLLSVYQQSLCGNNLTAKVSSVPQT